MKHLNIQMKQQQIEWRRAKVLELSSQGYSERKIAEKLQPLAVCTVQRFGISKAKGPGESPKAHP